jgi:hypothetical protein
VNDTIAWPAANEGSRCHKASFTPAIDRFNRDTTPASPTL